MVVPAMASASEAGDSENSLTVRAGSGTICDRAHGGKMVRHDRERQQRGRCDGAADAVAADRDAERGHAEQHAEHDGRDHQVRATR